MKKHIAYGLFVLAAAIVLFVFGNPPKHQANPISEQKPIPAYHAKFSIETYYRPLTSSTSRLTSSVVVTKDAGSEISLDGKYRVGVTGITLTTATLQTADNTTSVPQTIALHQSIQWSYVEHPTGETVWKVTLLEITHN